MAKSNPHLADVERHAFKQEIQDLKDQIGKLEDASRISALHMAHGNEAPDVVLKRARLYLSFLKGDIQAVVNEGDANEKSAETNYGEYVSTKDDSYLSNIFTSVSTDSSSRDVKYLGGFGDALDALKRGHKVTRRGWNGPGQFLELQVPDVYSKMTVPYIYIITVQGDRVLWLASQTDMLALDWQVSNG